MYNKIDKLASAIKNHVDSGLRGFHTNNSLSEELIKDEIVNERLAILKQYSLKGILPVEDLYMAINCIPVDCKDIEKCRCKSEGGTPTAHFEIPQLLSDYGSRAIGYIGSTDKQNPFIYYTSPQAFKNSKYRKRGKNKPTVWIDTTPNENGMYDGFIFNAPLIKELSVVAIFKDPRQLERYSCCTESQDDSMSFIDSEVVNKLSQRYLYFYRSAAAPLMQNDQSYQPG